MKAKRGEAAAKPWRKSRAAVIEEKLATARLFQLHSADNSRDSTCDSSSDSGSSSTAARVNYAAVVFCYEADQLLSQLPLPLLPSQESARRAVDAFRMVATNGGESELATSATVQQDRGIEIEAARKRAAQCLKEIGLESAMREALKKTSPGKWPVMHEIVRGIWCGGWTALNDNCRVLLERGITRVVSLVSTEKRTLPPQIDHHLHIQVHDALDAQLLPHFPRLCVFVEAARKAKAAVFIHCGAGISRAPSAVAACLMNRYHLRAKDALRMIKKARPVARPNVNFVHQLIEWEQLLPLAMTKDEIVLEKSVDEINIVDCIAEMTNSTCSCKHCEQNCNCTHQNFNRNEKTITADEIDATSKNSNDDIPIEFGYESNNEEEK